MNFTKNPAVRQVWFGERRSRLLGIFAMLILMAIVAGACGGDDDNGQSSPATGATGGATTTGSTAATGSGGGSTSGSSGSGTTPTQLADLTSLQSFRWEVEIRGAGPLLAGAGASVTGDSDDIVATGSYISPDQAQVVLNSGGIEFKQTIKGEQQWTTSAGTTVGPVAATSSAKDLIYVTSFVDPGTVASGMQCGGNENVNGLEAVRCETTEAASQQLIAGIAGAETEVAQASLVLWVAQQGNFVVRYEFKASGTSSGQPFDTSVTANITDVNNVSSIEP